MGGDAADGAGSGSHASSAWIRRAGSLSWSLLGIIALVVVVAVAAGAVSGVLIPLVIAVILGVVLEPVTEGLQRLGLPGALSAVLTLLTAVVVGVGTVAVVVWGFLQQWSDIYRQLTLGWTRFMEWAAKLDVSTQWLMRARAGLEDHAPALGQGVLGAVSSTFYGAVSLAMGTLLAVFFLFFALRDAHRFPLWFARTARLDAGDVDTVVGLSRSAIRGYFRGTAITALVTAPIFMVPLLLLGVPLALPIFILYFVLSFIPFLGAWITGVFAVLIAFGSVGPTAALILGITFVISNGTIQSVVSSWALGSSLRLHPVAVLLATMIGGTVAGLLGMVLGAPLVAAAAKSTAAVRRSRTAR
ncbi:putative PurR-regulated permease PerM [Mycolicibacterium iranicum]|uniref:Putative PurR-regulated permease PerM n=1 Tax=Mycolicibacterium iranicum TaxID=912594 RepID=A0A839QIQ5_MYCIR|nr:AI-2E family transporter [Mycolicibacterium iranicum]MBB2992181.1 putative PurR-regulated permease PerM [Mycolicibacterium iranicum]